MNLIGSITKQFSNKINIIHDDVYKKDCIKQIWINFDQNRYFNDIPFWQARVDLKMNNTKSEWKTNKHKDYDTMMAELKSFLESLD